MTSAKIDRMIDEKTLLLQHYLESKERIDTQIRQLEFQVAKYHQEQSESIGLLGRIEALGKRFGL